MIHTKGLTNKELVDLDEAFGYSRGRSIRMLLNRAMVEDATGTPYSFQRAAELTLSEYLACAVSPRDPYGYGYPEDIATEDHIALCEDQA